MVSWQKRPTLLLEQLQDQVPDVQPQQGHMAVQEPKLGHEVLVWFRTLHTEPNVTHESTYTSDI